MPFADLLSLPFEFFLDPTKRLFFVYLTLSGVMAFVLLYLKHKDVTETLTAVFDKRVWLSPSTGLDVSLLILNSLIKSQLFVFVVLNSLWVSQNFARSLYSLFPSWIAWNISYPTLMTLYTLTVFVLLDFSRFFQHYLFHKIPFLWQIHKVHHSARVLTPLTLYRTHPIESLVSAFRRVVVVGLISGGFVFFTQAKIDIYTILGVNMIDFCFNLLGSNLRHSHVWMSFGPLNYFFMSPAQHQIHHSRSSKHFDRNFGFALSCWDLLFGSFYQVYKKEFLIFGVRGEKQEQLLPTLKSPFNQWNLIPNNFSILINKGVIMKSFIFCFLTLFAVQSFGAITLYTDRPADKMQVFEEAFEAAHPGLDLVVEAMTYQEIRDRLRMEGADSPADVIMLKDLVYANQLTQEGRFQALNSTFAEDNVHPSMRTDMWTALTYRARTLVYDLNYDVSDINTYEDLADPRYAELLCLRTSQSQYNEGLAASMIQSYGYDKTFMIFDGWLNNLVDFDNIYTSDTTLILDMAKQDGTCTLGMSNSYYLGLQMLQNPSIPVGVKFLQMADGGVSTNGIIAGISATADNATDARRFIEFSLQPEMQQFFTQSNQDFPANQNILFPANIQTWSGFAISNQNWGTYGEAIEQAREMFHLLGYE
jgi:sterol desaturase/sphingolipid hydroxylase (fatty acid hydroxylase superfamily)/ABC-type Fe3+ transport system substrate-binding protein